MISKIRKFLDDNNNILISSLINFTFKNILVFFIIDILNFDPKKSYIYIISTIFIFSFVSNLKIGFSQKFKVNILIKWSLVNFSLLILENFIFAQFESIYNLKVALSILLSIIFYIVRFILHKRYVFN